MYVRLVRVLGEHIRAGASLYKVDELDLIAFVVDVLTWRGHFGFEQRTYPRDEALRLTFEVVQALVKLLVDY